MKPNRKATYRVEPPETPGDPKTVSAAFLGRSVPYNRRFGLYTHRKHERNTLPKFERRSSTRSRVMADLPQSA